jgi:putative tryptophan/tyrosine transport system substrate-binding protein
MRRRDVIALLVGGALAWPLVAHTQPGDRMRRVGLLVGLADDREGQIRVAAFKQRLRELGWIEGKNIAFDIRWAAGDGHRVRAYADELIAMGPDVILGASTPVALALRKTRTIPIVFAVVTDPIDAGLLANPNRPEGNITGFTNFEQSIGGKWLEILKELAPSITRLAIVFDPANRPDLSPYYRPSLQAAARKFGVTLIDTPVHTRDEIERALAHLAQPGTGVVVLPDSTTAQHRELLAASMAQHHLPAIYPYNYFARSGGLASYGIDTVDLFRRSAVYVDRILNGWKLADLPVQMPTKFEFVLNLKAAKALELDISPSLLARVDEVIE